MKLAKIILIILGLLGLAFLINNVRWDDNDFKVATIGKDGITIRNISKQRKMLNSLKIEEKVPIWIPGGLGWYQAGKVMDLLRQEKKEELISSTLFYNIGFVPDVVIEGEGDRWINNLDTIKSWGIANYVYYRLSSGRMMENSQVIEDDLILDTERLNEIIQRDFADSRLMQEEVRLSVYNGSQLSGLAGIVSRNLEWAGLTVVGIENFANVVDGCRIIMGSEVDGSYSYKVLKKVYSNCSVEKGDKLGKTEIELYLGDSFAQVLNYQSYKK